MNMGKLFAVLFLLLISFGYPLSPSEERQLIRDIAEIKATLKAFMRKTDKRFEAIDKRFELMDKRITELREDMNKRFEQLFTFLWIITGIFTTLTASVIAFAWWDRRTIIRKATEETVDYLEKEGKLRKLIEALREKAKTDKELEAILKKYGLL